MLAGHTRNDDLYLLGPISYVCLENIQGKSVEIYGEKHGLSNCPRAVANTIDVIQYFSSDRVDGKRLIFEASSSPDYNNSNLRKLERIPTAIKITIRTYPILDKITEWTYDNLPKEEVEFYFPFTRKTLSVIGAYKYLDKLPSNIATEFTELYDIATDKINQYFLEDNKDQVFITIARIMDIYVLSIIHDSSDNTSNDIVYVGQSHANVYINFLLSHGYLIIDEYREPRETSCVKIAN